MPEEQASNVITKLPELRNFSRPDHIWIPVKRDGDKETKRVSLNSLTTELSEELKTFQVDITEIISTQAGPKTVVVDTKNLNVRQYIAELENAVYDLVHSGIPHVTQNFTNTIGWIATLQDQINQIKVATQNTAIQPNYTKFTFMADYQNAAGDWENGDSANGVAITNGVGWNWQDHASAPENGFFNTEPGGTWAGYRNTVIVGGYNAGNNGGSSPYVIGATLADSAMTSVAYPSTWSNGYLSVLHDFLIGDWCLNNVGAVQLTLTAIFDDNTTAATTINLTPDQIGSTVTASKAGQTMLTQVNWTGKKKPVSISIQASVGFNDYIGGVTMNIAAVYVGVQ